VEIGALRVKRSERENGMIISQRFWRAVTLLVRVDMALAIAMTLALLVWLSLR